MNKQYQSFLRNKAYIFDVFEKNNIKIDRIEDDLKRFGYVNVDLSRKTDIFDEQMRAFCSWSAILTLDDNNLEFNLIDVYSVNNQFCDSLEEVTHNKVISDFKRVSQSLSSAGVSVFPKMIIKENSSRMLLLNNMLNTQKSGRNYWDKLMS